MMIEIWAEWDDGMGGTFRAGRVVSVRWFEEQRMKWIAGCIKEKGYVNRRDLMEKFGISTPQASKDLNTFQREMPDVMIYNKNTKRYEFNYRAF